MFPWNSNLPLQRTKTTGVAQTHQHNFCFGTVWPILAGFLRRLALSGRTSGPAGAAGGAGLELTSSTATLVRHSAAEMQLPVRVTMHALSCPCVHEQGRGPVVASCTAQPRPLVDAPVPLPGLIRAAK